MGHSLITGLAKTKEFDEVSRIIADGADVAEVAEATLKAAELAIAWVQNDAGFREAIWLLTQLGVAGTKTHPLAHLAQHGLVSAGANSIVDIVSDLCNSFQNSLDASRERSDFGDVSRRALAKAITGYLGEKLGGLFEPSSKDMESALKDLRKPSVFGEVYKAYVGGLTNESLGYYLSRELSKHLGHRFATANQEAQFKDALHTLCHESAEVVKKYGGEWFSKHLHEEGGDISRESAEGFGWYGMQKVRAVLRVKGKKHGN